MQVYSSENSGQKLVQKHDLLPSFYSLKEISFKKSSLASPCQCSNMVFWMPL